MHCFLRKMLVFLPLIGLAAEPTVPKSGGLCFRFDDNQTVSKWKDMAEVFRRNNTHFSMSIISHWIHSPEFSALLRKLQKEGHEIMDHTASHAVFTLPARTPEERREFESSPDFDHWNGDKACFRAIPDKSKFSRPVRALFSGNRVEGLPADREKEWKQTSFLYVPALKKAFLYSRKGRELHLRSFWNEDNVRFPERKELEFHLVPFRGGFLASDALLRLQAKVSAENFRRAGIRRPVTWIQPGGYEPVLTAENVRKVYEPLGYLGGATYPDSARKVYHEPDPERCRFAMMWGDFSLEKKDLAQLKAEIANRIARHQVLIGGGHMDSRAVPGGWTQFLKRHDELLRWCRETKIPVLTQKEWTERLYYSKPDPMDNVMPPLHVDRDGNGVPDGYSPEKGTRWADNAFSIQKDGVIFRLLSLTGMEVGGNRLSYRFRGAPGTKIHVKVQPFAKGWSPTYTRVFTQTVERPDPQTCTIRFDIPAGTRFLNLEFRASGVSGPLVLDNFSLTADR